MSSQDQAISSTHEHGVHDHADADVSEPARPGYYEVMETAVRELLIERRFFEAGEIRHQIEVLDSRTPALGAKVVARAWVDPEFRARFLANGRTACEELGITFYDDTGEYREGSQSDRLHLVFVLSAPRSWVAP